MTNSIAARVMRTAWANFRAINKNALLRGEKVYSAKRFANHLRAAWLLVREEIRREALAMAPVVKVAPVTIEERNQALAAEFTKWGTN